MSTVELTKDNFNEIVSENGFVLIDFWASWCGPCRRFAPVYEEASNRHDDLVFGKVDTEAQPELAGAFEIQSIPTLMIVRDSIAVFAQPGALPEAALEDVIAQARDLDMAQVRASVAEEQRRQAGRTDGDRAGADEGAGGRTDGERPSGGEPGAGRAGTQHGPAGTAADAGRGADDGAQGEGDARG